MITKKLSEVSIATRAWSILVLFAIGLLANTVLNIDKSREHMRENYERGVSTLVEAASGVAKHNYQQYKSGLISESEAKSRTLKTISR